MVKERVFVAGHRGMVGSAICRCLREIYRVELITKTRPELDLLNQEQVLSFMESTKPKHVILAAAKVGGIYANNTYPADFIYQNLQIQNNIIHAAHVHGVQKLLFLGSSCIYPKFSEQPISENQLLRGALEETNEPYAIAKIAGVKMCESYNLQYGRDYRSVMPTNLYGPGDNYHKKNSHVVPALIRRFHEAKALQLKEVVVWGSGNAMREFLFVDDLAKATLLIHFLEKKEYQKRTHPRNSHINIGTGSDITIAALAKKVSEVVGFDGAIRFDISKPDGTPRKLLNVDILKSLGWTPDVDLEAGLAKSYEDFLRNSVD